MIEYMTATKALANIREMEKRIKWKHKNFSVLYGMSRERFLELAKDDLYKFYSTGDVMATKSVLEQAREEYEKVSTEGQNFYGNISASGAHSNLTYLAERLGATTEGKATLALEVASQNKEEILYLRNRFDRLELRVFERLDVLERAVELLDERTQLETVQKYAPELDEDDKEVDFPTEAIEY